MFEHMTYKDILDEALDQIPSDVDKREGSIIYDALAPTALKLAEMYHNMSVLYKRTFAATADGDDLENRVNEHGVFRNQAQNAFRKAVFKDSNGMPLAVNLGSLFQLGDISYEVVEFIDTGEFKMKALTAGSVGNKDFGQLLPLGQINNLGTAMLTDVLIPGEDVETDESLYLRYLEQIREKPFGGNRAEYKKKIKEIQGVGGVRLYRAPQGGGTVTAIIIDSDFNVPSVELVSLVQHTVDPLNYSGDGEGTAPIGHTVTVKGAKPFVINFKADLTLERVSIGQVSHLVEEVLAGYFSELREAWVGLKENEVTTIRQIQIEARLVSIDGIVDVRNSTLNGLSENIEITDDLPVLGSVILNE